MSQVNLLIAGSGYIGQALARRIQAEGHYQCLLLRRSPGESPDGQSIQADLLRPETLTQLPRVDDVVYCAAADSHTEEAYRQTYQQGLAHLVQALRRTGGFRRLVYISSTSVYKEQSGAFVDETSQDLVHKGPSRFMVSAESELLAAPEETTVLRLGGIYGPQRISFLRRVQAGQERLYSQADIFSNRIHRDDVVGMILASLQDLPTGQIYNGVDSMAADRNEVIRWLTSELELNPEQLLKTDDFSLIQHRGNKRVRNDKILAAGYKMLYPTYREGYKALLDECKIT